MRPFPLGKLLTVAAAILAVLAAVLAILTAENILNRHVRVLRDRLANILAKAERVINNTPATAED